jgi:hypothetical protein
MPVMNVIDVPFLDGTGQNLQTLDLLLAAEPLQQLNYSPWPEFDTATKAAFSIAHVNDAILVRYEVQEEVLKSLTREFNEDVHLDNCIEFFIAFGSTSNNYYNIELNCLGSLKIGYGPGRMQRIPLEPELLRRVKVKTSMDYTPGTGAHAFKWQLLLYIPLAVFTFDEVDSLEGTVCRANFYKCGDDLPKPHFLAWNRIDTPTPDFHRPEFFGQLRFAKVKNQ